MKIWLDDIRPAPEGWTWIKDGVVVIGILRKDKFGNHQNSEDVEEISFDHDLGECYSNGYEVAKEIEEMAFRNYIKRIKWTIHSANPVGRANIERAMKNADKYWSKHEAT